MANCLQFRKESQAHPAVAGNSNTRAMVCELIAIKLLKEYNTRELIDALSFDFWPLQGLGATAPQNVWGQKNQPKPAAARTSTLEVAIRALAKKFLAHPLVVQQLEAIWAGNIVFHSAADSLHRVPPAVKSLGQQRDKGLPNETSYLRISQQKGHYGALGKSRSPNNVQSTTAPLQVRTGRTVTLYDPRDASLFKLSRLRVPRYRQFFSTCSLAVLLCLFLAVLVERSSEITLLEVIFWFWSAGFMLDEIVGFNEQGFSLYLMSFWNTFDLGILLLLFLHYCMRLYSLILVDHGRDDWNDMAYDVLATNAILLFPRLFSVLDHYRYFSQLLIAFRLMAVDLVAVFVLIAIACSGFFVAFTLSFDADKYGAAEVAYKIFQMVMGFTPAAWNVWDHYTPLGKAVLTVFLFLCHFLVVTILITVLTNSFMAIVSNANEEHQFVFAVNTISMVKSDALFSYVAPSNIFAWLLSPLMFVMPFPTFVKLNRMTIKVTHFPLLFGIYAYERIVLASSVFEPTDLVENHRQNRVISIDNTQPGLFSPNIRMRKESFEGFQKDKALDEVFRLAPRGETLRSMKKALDTTTKNAVRHWMERQDDEGYSFQEQDQSMNSEPEVRQREVEGNLFHRPNLDRLTTRSAASDPAEFMSTVGFSNSRNDMYSRNVDAGYADDDGDDELERSTSRFTGDGNRESDDEDYFQTPNATQIESQPSSSTRTQRPTERKSGLSPPSTNLHRRNSSASTILFNPIQASQRSRPESSASPPKSHVIHRLADNESNRPGNRNPKRIAPHSKPRPIMPSRREFQSVPNIAEFLQNSPRRPRHRRSSLDIGMSEMDLAGAVPSSFATQMALATGGIGKRREDTEAMMGRLMLAKMKTLEEGFAEMAKEFQEMRSVASSSVEGSTNGLYKKGKSAMRERANGDENVGRSHGGLRGEGRENEQRGDERND